jgi:hypothetical protein
MDIAQLAARESFLTKFDWTVGSSPNTTLFEIPVTPVLYDVDVSNGIHMTPSAWTALPFKYWRGKMKIRFQIVSSNYHKGRLRIQYDPREFGHKEFNTNYTGIYDIADDKDFTMEFGWGNPRHFLETGSVSTTPPFSTTGGLNHRENNDNGIVRVLILNELTVPNSTINNDIQVNVFVSFDQLELAQPTSESISELSYFIPQSGMEPQMGLENGDAEDTEQASAPTQSLVKTKLAKDMDLTDPTFHVFFGEQITSLRQILRRYDHSESYSSTAGQNVTTFLEKSSGVIPPYYGFSPNGVHQTSTSTAFNYTTNTYLNWVVPAYVAWRGSIRKKVMQGTMISSFNDVAISLHAHVQPSPTDYTVATTTYTQDGNLNYQADFYRQLFDNTFNGAVITANVQQPFLEFEVPFYTNKRFQLGKDLGVELDDYDQPSYRVVTYGEGGAGNFRTVVHEFVATGEDFSLSFFAGVPVVWVTTPPAPLTT